LVRAVGRFGKVEGLRNRHSTEYMYVWIYENGVNEIAPCSNVLFSPETSKVDDIKIKRNVSLFYLLRSLIFIFFLFSLYFVPFLSLLPIRSREIKVHMGNLV